MQQLRELPGHEPLAKDAERLFARGALPDSTYLVRDGRWFPELRPDAMAEPPPQPTASAVASGRNALEELNKRVASLENLVRGLQEQLSEALQALARAPVAPRVNGNAGTTGTMPAIESIPAVRPAARSMRSSAIPLAATQSVQTEPTQEADAPRAIGLPAMAVLSDLVKSLAGPDALLTATERVDWEQVATQQPVYCSPIQNHDAVEVGSMIFDLESALRMAGALLMESDDVVDALLEEKVMSDEMLDAASEVCNTLTSSFNKVSGNPHLRAGKMLPFNAARAAELAEARKRDDYRYSRGGHLSMIAR